MVGKSGRFFKGFELPYKMEYGGKAYESDSPGDLADQIWADVEPKLTCAGCHRLPKYGLWYSEDAEDWYCASCLDVEPLLRAIGGCEEAVVALDRLTPPTGVDDEHRLNAMQRLDTAVAAVRLLIEYSKRK
jgi:hypothetical protein